MDTLLLVAQIAAYIVAGTVVALHAIAPLTKTSKDDAALHWLEWVEMWLRKILPLPGEKAAIEEYLAAKANRLK